MTKTLLAALLVACNSSSPAPPPPPPPPPPSTPEVEVAFIEVFPQGGTTDSPLIVALHGAGDTPENFSTAFADFPVTAEIAVPRGIMASSHGRVWFPMIRDVSPAQLAANIREVDAKVWPAIVKHAHGRPIVVTGFSQGGVLSYAFAVLHPDAVRAAFPVAGRLPPPLWPTAGAKVALVHGYHGLADKVISPEDGEATLDAIHAVSPASEMSTFASVGHDFMAMRGELFEDLQDLLAAP